MREAGAECRGDVHVFSSDDGDDNSPEDRCACGDYTWGEMDRIKDTLEALEAMWSA